MHTRNEASLNSKFLLSLPECYYLFQQENDKKTFKNYLDHNKMNQLDIIIIKETKK